MTGLAPVMEGFFTERLIAQRRASPHTVASYRDAFRLLLAYVQRRTGKAPSKLAIEDLDAVVIGAFLDHLEHERHNSIRTRNNRLAAVHSLFAYAALRHPEHAALIQRVLAIPAKRMDRQLISFLTDDEVDAMLTAPDRDTWVGRRDHALLLIAVQTGLRVSELTSLTCADVAADDPGVRGNEGLAGRTQRSTWRCRLPEPSRRPAQQRRRRLPGCEARPNRSPRMPVARHQDGDAPRAAPHMCDASARRRGGHHRHRPLAGPLFWGARPVAGCLLPNGCSTLLSHPLRIVHHVRDCEPRRGIPCRRCVSS